MSPKSFSICFTITPEHGHVPWWDVCWPILWRFSSELCPAHLKRNKQRGGKVNYIIQIRHGRWIMSMMRSHIQIQLREVNTPWRQLWWYSVRQAWIEEFDKTPEMTQSQQRCIWDDVRTNTSFWVHGQQVEVNLIRTSVSTNVTSRKVLSFYLYRVWLSWHPE